MYAQNFHKVGLLSTYSSEMQRITEKKNGAPLPGAPLTYVGCQWKINVVLSTNYVGKVMRPEVQLEIYTQENVKIRMTVPVDRLEEMRRNIAILIRSAQ